MSIFAAVTMRTITSIILLCLCCVTAVHGQAGWNKDRVMPNTLFPNVANVKELFGRNVTSTVARSANAWVVNFYAAWCGHCQRFAPTWKNLATDIRDWQKMVRLAAVACSHANNTNVCRTHNINSYPSIKYFPPNSAEDYRGVIYRCHENVPGLRMCIINFLEGVIHTPLWWPRLQSFRSVREIQDHVEYMQYEKLKQLIMFEDVSNLDSEEDYLGDHHIHGAEDEGQYISMESNAEMEKKDLEKAKQYLGREVILDMSVHNSSVFLARMLKADGVNYGVEEYPSLYTLNEDGSISKIASDLDRKGFGNVIKRDILEMDITVSKEVNKANEAVTPKVKVQIPDGVHLQDLESGVYYLLWREVSTQSEISGDALEALTKHINALSQLLPVSGHVTKYLTRVHSWLSRRSKVSAYQWTSMLSSMQSYDAYIPERVIWRGCLGSVPYLRGYPCSLWTTFHTLTVSAYNATKHGSSMLTPKDVLLSVREYLRHFFGCRHCREHFLKMSDTLETDINSNEEGVLWLWRAHNAVNMRLHGDTTEDRWHPKMQFPSYSACAECHVDRPSSAYTASEWDEHAVLDYLIQFYGSENILQDAVPYIFQANKDFFASASLLLPKFNFIISFSLVITISIHKYCTLDV